MYKRDNHNDSFDIPSPVQESKNFADLFVDLKRFNLDDENDDKKIKKIEFS